MSGIRSSFMRYRRGDTGVPPTLAPAWLDIYNRSIGPITGVGALRSTSGQIDFKRRADVLVNDLFIDLRTARIFVVVQTLNRPASLRALVAEVSAPIPDEFDNGVLEKFWTENGVGTFTIIPETGTLEVTNGNPLGTDKPRILPWLYQRVTGDFDIYTLVRVSGGTAGISAGLYLKDDAASKSLLVGIVDLYTSATFYQSFWNTTAETTTLGPAFMPRSAKYVRLARRGSNFLGYYSLSTTVPLREDHWIPFDIPTTFATMAAINVGLASNVSDTSGVTLANFYFLRNWAASTRLAT